MRQAHPTMQTWPTRVFRDGAWSDGARDVIGETATAIVVNGGSEAVMMATCADLEDFALGFALTEGLVERPDQIRQIEAASVDLGVEVRLWLEDGASARHADRRRRRAGPAGCGLCGIESLEEAMRPAPRLDSGLAFPAAELIEAMRQLASRQPMNTATRAAHAAAFYAHDRGIVAVREDIGRHNALDKLVGALSRANEDGASGVILMTSRISIELVQKAAFLGSPVLAAISAPSSLAVEIADQAGLTLCGVVRDNGLEVFTHSHRIS